MFEDVVAITGVLTNDSGKDNYTVGNSKKDINAVDEARVETLNTNNTNIRSTNQIDNYYFEDNIYCLSKDSTLDDAEEAINEIDKFLGPQTAYCSEKSQRDDEQSEERGKSLETASRNHALSTNQYHDTSGTWKQFVVAQTDTNTPCIDSSTGSHAVNVPEDEIQFSEKVNAYGGKRHIAVTDYKARLKLLEEAYVEVQTNKEFKGRLKRSEEACEEVHVNKHEETHVSCCAEDIQIGESKDNNAISTQAQLYLSISADEDALTSFVTETSSMFEKAESLLEELKPGVSIFDKMKAHLSASVDSSMLDHPDELIKRK